MRPVILRRSQIFWQAWLFIWLQGKWKSRAVQTEPCLRRRKDQQVVKRTCTVYIHLFSIYLDIFMEVISPRDGATSHCSLFLKVFTGPIAFFQFPLTFWFDYIRRSAQRDFFIITFILFTSLCYLYLIIFSLIASLINFDAVDPCRKIDQFVVHLNFIWKAKRG